MATDFYHFDPVGDRDGNPSRYHHRFEDEKDFNVNPTLLKQLQINTCPETTPEGRALWLYLRLCQVLKYDEGNFYDLYRNHPNDDPYQSFYLAGDVTAETPTTCFNFSRIAVKLLNQIPGVHALVIAVGKNEGHFRFGYYTDKVAVDAEPTTSKNHFNDLARAKLGIEPQGLNFLHGKELMQDLMRKVAPPLLVKKQQSLQQYLDVLKTLPKAQTKTQIDIMHLVDAFRQQGVDGASMVQLLFDMNRQFSQSPYNFARAALVDSFGTVQPQLLVRKGKQQIVRIDLTSMLSARLPMDVYEHLVDNEELVYPYGSETGLGL